MDELDPNACSTRFNVKSAFCILPLSVTRSCVSSTGLTGSHGLTHTYIHTHACTKHTNVHTTFPIKILAKYVCTILYMSAIVD